MIDCFRSCLFLFVLLGTVAFAQTSLPTSSLPTGVRLDAVGDTVELGSMPLNIVPAPSGDKAVVVLSGWREQGIQVVDLKTRQVTQTLLQDGAFYGAAFSPDGDALYVSGGNTDMLFIYSWKDGTATLAKNVELSKTKSADGTGTSYPAGVAVAPNGKFVYVAENVGAFPPATTPTVSFSVTTTMSSYLPGVAPSSPTFMYSLMASFPISDPLKSAAIHLLWESADRGCMSRSPAATASQL